MKRIYRQLVSIEVGLDDSAFMIRAVWEDQYGRERVKRRTFSTETAAIAWYQQLQHELEQVPCDMPVYCAACREPLGVTTPLRHRYFLCQNPQCPWFDREEYQRGELTRRRR